MMDCSKPVAKSGFQPCGDGPDLIGSAPSSYVGPNRHGTLPLALETMVVGILTVTAIRLLNVRHAVDMRWLAIPCLLVCAALLPTWLRKGDFPPVCLGRKHATSSLMIACLAGFCVLPAVVLGLWVMIRMHLPVTARPAIAGPGGWFTWLAYQFLYVAVAEEVFFRGYLQTNAMRLLGGTSGTRRPSGQYAGIVVSAGCFAAAHVIVQGQIASGLTFLPGLVMAWLFFRTRSLLAPILFHGLANVSYGVVALILT